MKRRGGSASMSSLHFCSVAARCPLWQEGIMRREEGKQERGEDEERKGRRGLRAKGGRRESGPDQGAELYKM